MAVDVWGYVGDGGVGCGCRLSMVCLWVLWGCGLRLLVEKGMCGLYVG